MAHPKWGAEFAYDTFLDVFNELLENLMEKKEQVDLNADVVVNSILHETYFNIKAAIGCIQ